LWIIMWKEKGNRSVVVDPFNRLALSNAIA